VAKVAGRGGEQIDVLVSSDKVAVSVAALGMRWTGVTEWC